MKIVTKLVAVAAFVTSGAAFAADPSGVIEACCELAICCGLACC